jgi:putative oxidoreductase
MNLFGITFGYLFWGYIAALTEFFVGISYTIGFLTRLLSIPLICLLIVAIKFHLSKGDSFTVWGFAFTCLCIALNMLISGSGKYSVDYLIENFHKYEKNL